MQTSMTSVESTHKDLEVYFPYLSAYIWYVELTTRIASHAVRNLMATLDDKCNPDSSLGPLSMELVPFITYSYA